VMTVFHGDYEIEFEIYEIPAESEAWKYKKLGHIAALHPDEAKERWMAQNGSTETQEKTIIAIYSLEDTK